MRRSISSGGFTLIEVIVAMMVVSIITLGALSALRLFANKDNANATIYRSSISYKNIKNRLHNLITMEQALQPSYGCVKNTAPTTPSQSFQNALCTEEVYVDLSGKTRVNLTTSLTLNNGSGLCVYQVQLNFTPQAGAVISRAWMDQSAC